MDPSAPLDPFATGNDPFAPADGHRTFIRPNPAARTTFGTGGTSPEATGPATSPAASEPLGIEEGLNPLVALANPLLRLVPQLRTTRHVADVAALKASLAQGIREFAAEAHARGIAPERVMAARYVLCTMLDEAAADTPWGGSGAWARNSLLTMFHNEAWGGEKVFQLMARLAEKPEANRDLLELIYAALALGFEGRWRVVDNGRAQLDAVRDRLAHILKTQRGPYPAALAQHWAGQPVQDRPALSALPLAAAAAVALLLLVGIYMAMLFSLGGTSDPVLSQVQSLRLPPPVTAIAQPAPKPRLAQYLAPEIKANQVAVRDEVDRSVITLRGDGLFASGSARLEPAREALMGRVAEALAQLPGAVLVTGHTDNEQIRSARFPSNWHLSEERARSVRDLLVARGVSAERVRAEGRADGEPLVPNDSPANRAQNRRVEVTLLVSRPTEAIARANAATPAAAPASPPDARPAGAPERP